MSRSAFAAEFKLHVGATPAGYLLRWRVSLARSMLLGGDSIMLVGEKLSYSRAASFARAFAQRVGASPSLWLQKQRAGRSV
jgi:AraC-like DNA-binding protein